MDARDVLRDAEVAPSAAWRAARALWGDEVLHWVPETWRIELVRRLGVVPDERVVSKLLGAQTVLLHHAWTDHAVLFAFALVCDGVTPARGFPQHPTVDQLAWAVEEIHALFPGTRGTLDDAGFDPDEVDAAVACVLIDDGWYVPPPELAFCDEVFRHLRHDDTPWDELVEHREKIAALPLDAVDEVLGRTKETSESVMLSRLIDCRRHVEARAVRRAAAYALAPG